MTRLAIVGSCITRDLWPFGEARPDNLLLISRSSLASLMSTPVAGYDERAEPPEGLSRFEHRTVEADLTKTALGRLAAHAPTHVIVDLIDERFDLLAGADGGLITHSWELEHGGYLAAPELAGRRAVPRLSPECEHLWREACVRFCRLFEAPPLADARLILHSARWAERLRTPDGEAPLGEDSQLWPGRPVNIGEHNALLARCEDWFLRCAPQAQVVAAPAWRLADPDHRWGLSPFHYAPEYYGEIRRQIAALGL